MNLRYIECVQTVLSSGSISSAARSMYVSQSAVSQMIQRIEKELGAFIFNRETDPISLTFAGEKYLDAAREILAINARLQNEIYEISSELRGRLRLGISLQRGMQLLPLIIPEFIKRYPHVQIELTEKGSSLLEKALHDGDCDIALITTEPKYRDISYTLLENEEVMLIAGNNSSFANCHKNGDEISIQSVADETFVSLQHGHSVRVVQDDLFRKNNIQPKILLETDSLEGAKNIASSGAALMLCPNVYLKHPQHFRDSIKYFHIRDLEYRRHFYFCHRKDMELNRFMDDFFSIVKEKISLLRIGELL
ncbi:MAG: LysR family transcriptional regulator [Christensenellales bacterium]|jgi:DNA-binding transcriptional LysR family regulator